MTFRVIEGGGAPAPDGWALWSQAEPPEGAVIRLRGEIVMTGGGTPEPDSRFCRRGQALCLIPPDGGAMHIVQPPYQHLEWIPG